jgi:hypothetical protein
MVWNYTTTPFHYGSTTGPRTKIREQDITGLKYFDKLAPLLERLHDSGCQRDAAGNRTLHFDQYCMCVLLFLFNPIVTSLRALHQASELKKVQKKLGCARSSLGSLSESVAVFEPERLKEIIAELGGQLETVASDARLADLPGTLTAVDATLINALPAMAEASLWKSASGRARVKWRLHTHFEVDRYEPARIDVTREAGGDADERAVLERTIERAGKLFRTSIAARRGRHSMCQSSRASQRTLRRPRASVVPLLADSASPARSRRR